MEVGMSNIIQGSDAAILYHYTTPEGLLGILKEGVIRATDARFSNDWMEIQDGLELLKEILFDPDNANSKQNTEIVQHLQLIWASFKSKFTAYIFATTEEGDDLSQWRGYTPSSGGFALGFKAELLKHRTQDLGLHVSSCEYMLDEKKKILVDIVDHTLQNGSNVLSVLREAYSDRTKLTKAVRTIVQADLGFEDEDKARNFVECIFASNKDIIDELMLSFVTMEFMGLLAAYTAIFKNDSFLAEKEVRMVYIPSVSLITPIPIGKQYNFEFRARYGMIIPYAELPILRDKEDKHHDILAEIVIGPRSIDEKSLAEKSLRFMLERYGYDDCTIRSSSIPFRTD